MKHATRHSVELSLPVSFIKEDTGVVMYTPALDISTVGKDEVEARENFNELISIFFDDLIENNTVDEVLLELGWRKNQMAWSPPRISQELINVNVPV